MISIPIWVFVLMLILACPSLFLIVVFILLTLDGIGRTKK